MKFLSFLFILITILNVGGQTDCTQLDTPDKCFLVCRCGTCTNPTSNMTWTCTTQQLCAPGNVFKPACTPAPTSSVNGFPAVSIFLICLAILVCMIVIVVKIYMKYHPPYGAEWAPCC